MANLAEQIREALDDLDLYGSQRIDTLLATLDDADGDIDADGGVDVEDGEE